MILEYLFTTDSLNLVSETTDTLFGILILKDFFFWFLGATIFAFYEFRKIKNLLEIQAPFNYPEWRKAHWEDIVWIYLGSLTMLLLIGIGSGVIISLNDLNPNAIYAPETSFIIGLVGSLIIEKFIESKRT